ncbi:M23 family metallopeptidase [Paludifilum halophilum]|uniref:Peptidase M23 n=1 Tax=Paludifilum halophilum TaxID=1642702 RepID=A0A235B4S7_9BACL|nr:M23 family metallopeptidase [Paludifilum halophilum]OYD07242.1 peptidase M23 [Paludifilum halophilum]
MGKRTISTVLIFTFLSITLVGPAAAHGKTSDTSPPEARRQFLLEKMETLTGIPWYLLAAMDQYERNVQRSRPDLKEKKGLIAITVPSRLWTGVTNPDPEDTIPESILFFGGIGRDGNRDGKADPNNELDVLYTVTRFLSRYGHTWDDLREGLWNYYQHPTPIDIITHIAEVYKHYGTTQLDGNHFLMPLRYNYTYHNTWGDRRGYGGLRIHEGTDVFADYGTPVLSTCYGYVELRGWNRFGGWRIGIRDLKNNYHYFAHLSRFNKDVKKGDVVAPGEIIGYVGSSGYGPPGTSGKFPPHLHYGMYKFNGKNTFSFDPYPYLKAWERATAKKQRDAKKKEKKRR